MKLFQWIFKKKRNTQAYKYILDIDIENISIFEKRNKVNTIKWRPIYEVIGKAYFIDSKILTDYFLHKCKDNANAAQFIPLEMKNSINQMTIEQGL